MVGIGIQGEADARAFQPNRSLARARQRIAQETGVEPPRLPVEVAIKLGAADDRADPDGIARLQPAQCVERNGNLDEIGVFFIGHGAVLRRTIELLQTRARHIAEFRVEPENALPDIQPRLGPAKVPVLKIAVFVAQNAAHAWCEVRERKILQNVQPVRPLPVRVQDAVADAGQVRHSR